MFLRRVTLAAAEFAGALIRARIRSAKALCKARGLYGGGEPPYGWRRGEAHMGQLVAEARAFLSLDAPVGEHLADQLLLPLVMAGGGEIRVAAVSSHTRTNAEVLTRLLGASIRFVDEPEGARVVVEAKAG